MDQIKYQGYARDRGFNPIQLSTGSVDAIQQQGNALARQLRENQGIENQNRNEFLSGLRNAQQMEAQNRASNFEFAQRSREAVNQAELFNQRQKANNFQIQSDNVAKVMAPLADLSKTIATELVGWQKRKNDAEMEQAYVDTLINGPDPNQVAAVEAGMANMRKSDDLIQTTADKLQDSGATPEAVRAVRKLSKWGELGRAKALAQLASMEFGGWLEQQYATDAETEILFRDPNSDQPVKITPKTALGPDQKTAVNTVLFRNFLKAKGLIGVNPAFISDALLSMRKQMNEAVIKEQDSYEKAVNEQESEQVNFRLQVGLETDPITAVNEAIMGYRHLSDPKTGQRYTPLGAFNKVMERLIGTGNRAAIEAFADSPSYMPGKTWGELRDVEFRDALRKLDSQEAEDEALQDRLTGQERENWSDEIMQELSAVDGGADEATVQQAIDKSRELFGGWVDPRLEQYATNLTLQARDLQEQEKILSLLAQNDELTVEELESGKYNWKLREKFRAAADAGSKATEAQSKGYRDTYKKALSDALMLNAGIEGYGDKKAIPTFYFAEAHALKQLDNRARTYMNSGKVQTLEEAYSMAAQDVLKEIEKDRSGADGKNKFGTYAFSDKGEFRRWGSEGSGGSGAFSQAKASVNSVIQQVSSGGIASVTNRKLLSLTQVKALDDVNAPVPEIVQIIANNLPKGKSMSAFEIIDAQRALHGLPPRQRPYVQAQVETQLSPRLQELLNRVPTALRTRRALTAGGMVGPGPDRQAIQFIAQSLGVDPVDIGTIINFETGGNLTSGQYRRGLDRWGGDGGQYLGWIQFSPDNQKKYGIRPGMAPMEMAQAVVQYMKDWGIQPGDNIATLYQAVQAPAYVSEARRRGANIGADSNGAVSAHLTRMQREHRNAVGQWLMEGAAPSGTRSTFRDPRLMSAPARKLLSQYQMTSEFGASESFRGGRTHGGQDFATPMGTKLSFKQPGTVIEVGDPSQENGGYGGFIKVRLRDGQEVLLAHLDQVKVRPGQRLGAKQIAALSGNTGRSTGAHTHVEAYDRQGRRRNPASVISEIYADI